MNTIPAKVTNPREVRYLAPQGSELAPYVPVGDWQPFPAWLHLADHIAHNLPRSWRCEGEARFYVAPSGAIGFCEVR
jgi:hypothetical protein